jgi:CubicO group peptidase (beta-lactamase class C family)
LKKRPLEFEPGSRISHSNNGYSVLGRVIEKVSGQPWDEYLRDHIFYRWA